ncbi:MAG: phosphatidate cytidylyltransferase [Gemmatimonadota bacterium]
MNTWREGVEVVAEGLGVGPGLGAVALALILFLTAGTTVRGWGRLRKSDPEARRRWHSVATWWILTVLFLVVLAFGPPAVVLVMGGLSLLLLREALRLVAEEQLLIAGMALVIGVYAWAWLDWETLFLAAFPVVLVILVVIDLLWRWSEARRKATPPWLRRARPLAGAPFLAVLGPSYAVAVAYLPAPAGLPASGMGWLALLFVLTELNDSAQAWGGRAFGVRRMAPRLSPGKTWAGFWSGLLTTAMASAVIGPLITSYAGRLRLGALGLGLLIALAGIAGDLLESSLKRQAGVKDSGDLLPGHGGLMDRFDSLAMTAPVFFAVTWILWF